MKSIKSIFVILLFSAAVFCQETNVAIQKIGTDTIIHTTTTTYDDGRVIIEQVPYTIDQFANLMVDQNLGRLIQIDKKEDEQTTLQRDVNLIKKYLTDSLSANVDSLMNEKLFTVLAGDWVLTERDNGVNTETNVTIGKHPVSNAVLRMTNNDQPGGWNIRNISTHSWQINNYDIGGSTETVKMTLRQFPNFTGYDGKTSNGKRLILRPK